MKMMKTKIISIIFCAIAVSSCYDDYIIDYENQAVGFANQTDVRTVVVGEGMQFKTGVALGGVIDNDINRIVEFEIDGSLVNDETLSAMKSHTMSYIQSLTKGLSSLEALPAKQYTLVPDGGMAGKIVIREGTHLGVLTIVIDSAAFLSDESRTIPKYVIPLRITGCDSANVLEGRETSVIGVRYENMLFGNWYHGGSARKVNNATNAETSVGYPTTIPQSDNLIWTLTTVSPNSLTANAVGGELNGSAAQMKLTLQDDGSVTISSVSGAKYTIVDDGGSHYNKARLLQDRKIFLNYSYSDGDYTYHATDTLTFRNRIRDGVNEWQDEHEENYK